MKQRIKHHVPPLRRAGLTLIEVLVVLGIIAILASLLLPAVQGVRESARKTQCRSNLRQIGLAIASYEGSHRTFPMGASIACWNYQTMLLPYVDRAALYHQIDFSNDIVAEGPNRGLWHCSAETHRLRSLGINLLTQPATPLFLCPSDPHAGVTELTEFESWRGSYTGVRGTGCRTTFPPGSDVGSGYRRDWLPPPDCNGVLMFGRAIAQGEITDGCSQTLIAGEHGVIGADTREALCADSHFSVSLFAERVGPQNPLSPLAASGFWSHHQGGEHYLFCDGHVSFVSTNTSNNVFASLATRAGQEPPTERIE